MLPPSRLGQGLGADACHCMHCNACMALSEFPHHKCRDLSTCPVCTEYLFDSAQPYRVSTLYSSSAPQAASHTTLPVWPTLDPEP